MSIKSTISKVTPSVVLTIAGSDSGGSAGIQADLKTFEARGVFGTSAITVVTAQNTQQVIQAHALSEAFIQAQIEAVLSDMSVNTIKTGLLGRASVITLVATMIQQYQVQQVVVDPVLVNGQGQQFVDDEGVKAYQALLFPLATVITPNLDEAQILTGLVIKDRAGLYQAAEALMRYQPQAVLVKGGHLTHEDTILDLFYDGENFVELTAPRLSIDNPHGVGCTFASATAAELAKGATPENAVRHAHQYLQKALAGSQHWSIGAGRTPVYYAVGNQK